jgi:hypothetical protein
VDYNQRMGIELHPDYKIVLRHEYAKQFHEVVETATLLSQYLTPNQALTIVPVEGIYSSNLRRLDSQSLKENVWVSGYTAHIRQRNQGAAKRYTIFAGLTQLEKNDWKDGKFQNVKANLAVKKSFGRSTPDHIAAIGVDIDRLSSLKSLDGPYPVFELAMEQLANDRFVAEAKDQLDRSLKKVLVEGFSTSLSDSKYY